MIPRRLVASAVLRKAAPRALLRELRGLVADGAALLPRGEGARCPSKLLDRYPPRSAFTLFGTDFYLSEFLQNPTLRFFVAYLVQSANGERPTAIHPRIFYKDVSLVWRCASHWISGGDFEWIGKGDVRTFVEDGFEITDTVESTTDLPVEAQLAVETASRRQSRIPEDEQAVALVLRRGPVSRVRAYRDFYGPRERAAANRRNLVNGGRSIARFTRKNDPTSLRFKAGFEPEFARGVIEKSSSKSSMYGGHVRRYRIVSRNRQAQYLFFAGKRHVWIMPPQATTTELSSYGVRTIDVVADEDVFVPGFEYHYLDDSTDPPEVASQIPEGFAGEPSPKDPERADASAWLDRLPVVREFRRRVLGQRRRRAGHRC